MANRCKYQKYQYQVSYDSGSTWQNVTPEQVRKGNIIESPSADCGEIETQYRWVDLQGTYICDGNNKYTRRIQEESYDGGVTWYASYPTVYSTGDFVGVDAEYCADKFVGHYSYNDTFNVCPSWYAWNGYTCVYVDPLKVVKCNNSTTLTKPEILYYISNLTLLSAEIGDCVTTIDSRIFKGYTGLTSCTIGTGVTEIGYSAFSGCTNLRNINIPGNTASNVDSGYIGNSAFTYCTSLESAIIGYGFATIGQYAFNICSGMTTCVIGSGSIGDFAFSGCTSLTSCTIGSGVTSIGASSFRGCNSLLSINVPGNVTTIGEDAFYSLPNLSSATIYATSIGNSAFERCSGLTSCTIGSGVTSIGQYSFRWCHSLLNINISDSVTSIGHYAFYGCNGMTACTIGSGITSIGQEAFYGCTSLTSISCLSLNPPSIGANTFYYSNDCPIYVPCENIDRYKSATNWHYYAERIQPLPPCDLGIKFEATYKNGSINTIACNGITSVTLTVSDVSNYTVSYDKMVSATIYECVTSIENNAFRNCTGLTSITVDRETPPTLIKGDLWNDYFTFDNTGNCPIYVPQVSVSRYKSATGWNKYSSRIQAIPT